LSEDPPFANLLFKIRSKINGGAKITTCAPAANHHKGRQFAWSDIQERKEMLIGYARVSSTQQNLDRQLGALRAQRCDRVFTERASAKSLRGRPQLERAIDALGNGDILVLAEWDRATRSMMDGITIMQRVHARGAGVKVLDKPHLDLSTPIGRGFLAFLSALAEDERERIHKRASEGRRAAVACGVHMGRKPKLTEYQRRIALERMRLGESARAIAKEWGVAHTTVSRVAL
jgi:DNA invertase Pin-like site-specific DNA recombinase